MKQKHSTDYINEPAMIFNLRKFLVLLGSADVRKENMQAFEMLLGLERENISFSVNQLITFPLCVHVCVFLSACAPHAYRPQWKPEDSVTSSGPGVAGGCESLIVGSGN